MNTSVRFYLSYDCFKQSFITLKVELFSVESMMLSGKVSWHYVPVTKCKMWSYNFYDIMPQEKTYQQCNMINIFPFRAATIVLRDDNCHFLRVDKDDFNRILRVSWYLNNIHILTSGFRHFEVGECIHLIDCLPFFTKRDDYCDFLLAFL